MGSISKAFEVDSSQLNNIDLVGGPRTIKIRDAELTGKSDQPMNIYYEGDEGKPYRPGKSMGRIIGYVWGDDEKDCIGHSMTLFRDPDVRFGPSKVGGIRISHMTGLKQEKRFPVLIKRGVMGNYAIKPLVVEDAQPASTAPTITEDKAIEVAMLQAEKGKEAFNEWWLSPSGRECRNAFKERTEELKPKFQAAIEAAETTDEVPFT